MKKTILTSLILSLSLSTHICRADEHPEPAPETAHVLAPTKTSIAAEPSASDEALKMLIDGNTRYAAGEQTALHQDQSRRCETVTGGQHPYATILSCADSRVPPEIVFDAGIGDLFVVRVAGNVADTDEIATIEYGASHLNSPLIVVMGHTKCGAVTAVVDGAPLQGNLAKLMDNITPAVKSTKEKYPELKGPGLVAKAVRANVFQAIDDLLSNSQEVRELVKAGKVRVVGAVYDLHLGKVEILGEHPMQSALLKKISTEKPDTHAELVHEDKTADAKSAENEHATVANDHKPVAKTIANDDKADEHAPVIKSKDEHADTAHEQHSSAIEPESKKEPTTKPAVADVPTNGRYIAMGAFVIGTVALSAVVVHLVRAK